jgi:hypothetical protein
VHQRISIKFLANCQEQKGNSAVEAEARLAQKLLSGRFVGDETELRDQVRAYSWQLALRTVALPMEGSNQRKERPA